MAGKALTRKSKAATLVPLALVSAVWTASIVSVGTSATAAKPGDDKNLPDGTAVPQKAIEAPASIPVAGAIAPAVPDGASNQVVASASTNGIPAPALSAYQRAAQIMDSADSACHVPWELIGAIGRVESDHGRYGGNTLTADGVSKPGVYGPQLNGKNGTQAIQDTDGGELDRDPVFDRAVGAMQFIPSTWSVVKVDADGDARRNPQDIDDAALATAVYLCSGSEDLGTREGQETAVYRYNHSRSYVDLVLRIMEAYSQGDYTAVPSGTYGGTLFTPSYTAAIDRQERANRAAASRPGARSGGPGSRWSSSSPSGTSGSSGGTGGTTSGTDGTDVPGTDGTDGTDTPTSPDSTSTVTDPVTKAIEGTKTTVQDTTSQVTEPVVDLITSDEALSLCSDHFSSIAGALKDVPLVGNVYDDAMAKCTSRLDGEKQADASTLLSAIPTTVTGVLRWLGL